MPAGNGLRRVSVGRRPAEVSAVEDLLTTATTGPAALLVEGDAGIGKTTLIRGAIDSAVTRGFAVLTAGASATEVPCTFAAVADLLADVADEHLHVLSEQQRTALSRTRFGDHAVTPNADERMAASAFTAVLETLAVRTPVLLAVDDVQWLDASSRIVVGFAARRLTGRVALLLARRSGEPDRAAAPSAAVLPHPEILTRIVLGPLDVDDLTAVIADRLGRAPTRPSAHRIHHLSGGNPMLAIELARGTLTGVELLDEPVAVVRDRLDSLEGDPYAVLLTAACSAAPTTDLVLAATGLSPARLQKAVESLEAIGLIVLNGHRIAFTHPLFAEGVRSDADPGVRREVHRGLATATTDPESRARHLALCATSGDPATLDALDAGTDVLVARGAPAAAAELLDLATGLGGGTAARRIRAAELHFRSGSVAAARAHLHAALDGVPRGPERALALAHLGAVRAYDDDLSGAVDAFVEAAVDATDVPTLRLMCQIRLSLALAVAGRMAEALSQARGAAELAANLDAPALRSQALSLVVTAGFIQGDGVDDDALQTALDLEDPCSGATSFLRARAVEAVMSAYTGDLALAEARMRAVRADMLAGGTESDLVWADNRLAAIAVWAGRYDEAYSTADGAVRRAEQLGARFSVATARTRRAAAAAFLGREDEARTDARAALDAAYSVGALRQMGEPSRVLGFLEVSLSDYAAALAALQPLLDDFDPPRELEIDGGGHLPDAVEALVALGRLDRAERLVDALETHGARRDRPWMSAVGARGRAALHGARGNLVAAERALEHAVAQHHRMEMPFELARTRLLQAEVQRRLRRAVAADTLAAALGAFEALGTRLWAQRARNQLTAATERRRLTATERRCADLAATGLSNREIATALSLAEKTVESSLSRVFRKLGIRRRSQLRVALDSG